jgi:Icc protein
VGIDWLDQIGVTNGADFLQLIEQFPQVKIVTFGHIHWDMQHRHHHTWFYGCPSSCVQLELPPPHSPHPGFRWFTLWEGGHHDSSVERFAIQRS